MWFCQTVTDLDADADLVRRHPYGVIEMERGRLQAIHLKPWPKIISVAGSTLIGGRFHDRTSGDRCWLYYNQPRFHRNFLVLKYIVSTRQATLGTFHGALVVLDQIARLKQSDAILCEVTNHRISERLLHRWGWERHVPHSRRRHFIKRFYGTYPAPEPHRWRREPR